MIRPSLAAGNSSDFLSSTSSLGCNKANCCFSPCTSVQTRRGCLSKERASHFHIVLSAEISPRNAIGGLSRHLPVKTCMLTCLCGFGTCKKKPFDHAVSHTRHAGTLSGRRKSALRSMKWNFCFLLKTKHLLLCFQRIGCFRKKKKNPHTSLNL